MFPIHSSNPWKPHLHLVQGILNSSEDQWFLAPLAPHHPVRQNAVALDELHPDLPVGVLGSQAGLHLEGVCEGVAEVQVPDKGAERLWVSAWYKINLKKYQHASVLSRIVSV